MLRLAENVDHEKLSDGSDDAKGRKSCAHTSRLHHDLNEPVSMNSSQKTGGKM